MRDYTRASAPVNPRPLRVLTSTEATGPR